MQHSANKNNKTQESFKVAKTKPLRLKARELNQSPLT